MHPDEITVSVIKDGQIIASDKVADPHQGDVEATITRLISQLRKQRKESLWPFEIRVQ